MSNEHLEKDAERIAKQIAHERGMPSQMWELCLTDAYMRLAGLEKAERISKRKVKRNAK